MKPKYDYSNSGVFRVLKPVEKVNEIRVKKVYIQTRRFITEPRRTLFRHYFSDRAVSCVPIISSFLAVPVAVMLTDSMITFFFAWLPLTFVIMGILCLIANL